ncbi:MAG TPA: hypothetical protein EYO89_00875, partial [Candidatus Dadabacteria bacterium]|nr:hypothetical protein [Candidatus Dadabacteria bacterium]
ESIINLKKQILLNGCGFFVLAGSSFKDFTVNEKKSIYIIISKILGKLLKQNKKGELVVDVVDMGKTMGKGSRYHHTREGGSYHTDGSHIYSEPPDYVGLLCINPAKKGGESKFMSAYNIHNKLQEKKELLRILYRKFYHDKKGENKPGESSTQFEPIFEYINGQLKFKYQRELINSGHDKANQALSEKQIEALNLLDDILKNDDRVLTYRLEMGDMMFSNNRWLIHDRTNFEDYEDEKLKRYLIRTWIRESY